ncbi:MAG: carbohydrate ABC transporter permease [bacterium]|nr:carbohydrate ABC transporter permease [Candidatus Sumerlaeota bacterium]
MMTEIESAGASKGMPEGPERPAGWKSTRSALLTASAFLAAFALAALMIAPFFWLASTAVKAPSEVFRMPPALIPSEWMWGNFIKVWTTFHFSRYYLNSIIVTVCVVAGQVVTSAMAAYAFARLEFPGRDKLFLCYLATLMVPGAVTMIPLFIIMKFMGMIWTGNFYLFGKYFMGAPLGLNSYFALIIPGCFSAYGTFLLRQFFMGIPKELEESVKIDGGGHRTIFSRIILPLSGPGITTLAIFTMLGSWRDFIWPLIMVNQDEMRTLPIGLSSFQGIYFSDWPLLMAAALLIMAPLVVIFFFAQRFFVEGIKLQGIKG